jgi:hypothetical protein
VKFSRRDARYRVGDSTYQMAERSLEGHGTPQAREQSGQDMK